MAEIFNIRDYQSAKDRERIAKMAREIMDQIDTSPSELMGPVHYTMDSAPCEKPPYGGAGIDGMWPNYKAPDKDPA
jgi:hypothetical protein